MSGATHTVADLAPCADDLARLRREDVPHPVIFVGTGTCGLGAGAAAVQSAAAGYLAAREIKGDAVGVGCIGLCAFEPLMDVQLPGRPRLCFGSVAPEEVAMLLDGALAGNPDTERALFQFSPNGHSPWERIPRMEEHPFFAAQTRRVLCNCGLIDPGNLDEYLARGGYGALHRALESMTPEQVGREVEASGLRGRGGGGFPPVRPIQPSAGSSDVQRSSTMSRPWPTCPPSSTAERGGSSPSAPRRARERRSSRSRARWRTPGWSRWPWARSCAR